MNNREMQPQQIDLFSEEYERRFKTEGKIYKRKIKTIKGARQVSAPARIKTVLADGTLESIEDARSGDWVITGSEGEEFVIPDEKFHELYEPGEDNSWIPRERMVTTIANRSRKPVRIDAPWGGTQEGSEKAIFVAELDPDRKLTEDRYIIGNRELLLENYIAV